MHDLYVFCHVCITTILDRGNRVNYTHTGCSLLFSRNCSYYFHLATTIFEATDKLR
jgi:hypothetical protein